MNEKKETPISWDAFNAFLRRYRDGARVLGIGNAFLNAFDHIPEVTVLRPGPLIWDETCDLTLTRKLQKLNIIPGADRRKELVNKHDLHRTQHGHYAFWSENENAWVPFIDDVHLYNTFISGGWDIRFLRVDYTVPLPKAL